MGQPISQIPQPSQPIYKSQPNKSWLAQPGEGNYKRWTSMHILLRISQWGYPKWKPYAMMHKDLEELICVYGTDHYMYIYMKFKRKVQWFSRYNVILLRPYDTYHENVTFLHKKGTIYEHEYITCEEIIEEKSEPQQSTKQQTNQPVNKPTSMPTNIPTDSSKQKAQMTAKEILELTPEQAIEQLTLEQYDLYCKYKK